MSDRSGHDAAASPSTTIRRRVALKSGEVKSDRVALDFSDIKPANKFFKPMVREQKFDVSEMAIGTFLQAKAYGKPLVLLPATIMGRFQHGTHALQRRARHAHARPTSPASASACAPTARPPAIWLRGILTNDYGVDLRHAALGHVRGRARGRIPRPAVVERAGAGQEHPADAARRRDRRRDLRRRPARRSGAQERDPDPDAAAQQWYAKHKVVPINHMVVVTEKLAKSNPDAVREVFRLLAESKQAAGLPKPGAIDFLPFGLEACRPALWR